MKIQKFKVPLLILAVCLLCMTVLLLIGYRVEKPAVETAEFPFSVTYEYQGKTETFTGTYICRAGYSTKYFGSQNRYWYGYIENLDPGSGTFIRIHETDNTSLALCFNYDAAYLMGDPRSTSGGGENAAPYGEYFEYYEDSELHITDAAELEKLGFRIIDWTDIQPINNSFKPGGIMLSGEAGMYLAVIMLVGLICCMIFVKKEQTVSYNLTDKLSIALNFLTGLIFLPFVTIFAGLSDLVASGNWIDLITYALPCITLTGLAASLVARRKGYRIPGLWAQFVGPVMLALVLMADALL